MTRVTASAEPADPLQVSAPESVPETEAFDPGDYTVAAVVAYVEAHPDEAQALYDAELRGKARTTLLADLEARL